MCRIGFGLEVSGRDGRRLDELTSGWTAAAVLAASRAKRAGRPLSEVGRIGGGHEDAVQSILEEALASSGQDRGLFALIAGPPLLNRELLAQITGELGFLERALAWGLPMTRTAEGWWTLPDPVREHLAALAPVDGSVLRAAAGYYERHGAVRSALQMLLAAGDGEAAAELLDRADPWVIDTVDSLELLSVLDVIPDAVIERYPRALLTVARCCAGSWMTMQSSRLLARVDSLVSERDTPQLRRAVDVELLVEQLDAGDREHGMVGARRVLAGAGDGEQLARARALTVLGQQLCGRRAVDGRLDLGAMREASDCLQRAALLQLHLGNRPAAATTTTFRALWLELPLGRYEAALEVLGSGLDLAAGHPRRFAQILFCRARVLTDLGRQNEVAADLDEVLRIGRQLGDRWLVGYVAWERMRGASLQGDADATLHHAREATAEGQTAHWWMVDGSEFLADAADCLDRVGCVALATDYLERAQREPKQPEPEIAMAQCALLARHGDPGLARRRLAAIDRHGVAPRERWRATLLDAYAAFRQGDPAAGGLAARSFEQAAALGQPQAPLVRERDLAESLLGLALETGLPGARALHNAALPVAVAVLGRFEVTSGGRTIALGNSQEARLVKLVAVNGGRVHVERAIEALWPEVDPRAGRNRLRTTLNRLRSAVPAIIERDGEQLTLGPGTRLDLVQFLDEAREARALVGGEQRAAVAVARSAIARYRGPLLPSDPYEMWAEEPRERAQRTMLDLLDMCAATAAEQGDLDGTRRLVEQTIELAPYDDHRYLRVATILHDQGQKGAALSVLRRARSALAQLGVDPPSELVALERTVAAVGTRRSIPGSVTPV